MSNFLNGLRIAQICGQFKDGETIFFYKSGRLELKARQAKLDRVTVYRKVKFILNMNGRWQFQSRRGGDQMSSLAWAVLNFDWGVLLLYSAFNIEFLDRHFLTRETQIHDFFPIYDVLFCFLQFAFFAKAAADQSRLCDVVLSSLVVRYPKEIKSKQNMSFSRNTPILCNGKIACEQRLCC